MSVGDSAARLTVAAAVTLLPSSLRDRYREQWHADLRDAPDAGVKRSEIAWGSLAFAVTVDRVSIESERVQAAAVVRKRERLASGLALGVALVALTHTGSVAGFGWNGGFGVLDFLLTLSEFLLASYLTLAPIAAILMVSVTRGVDSRVRWAVWMLVVASAARFAQLLVDGTGAVYNVYATPGAAIYGIAVVLTMGASILLLRRFGTGAAVVPKRPVAAIAGALVIAGAVSLGLANLKALVELQRIVSADFVDRIASTNPSDAAVLAASLLPAEQAAVVAVAVWGVVGLAAVFALAIVGFTRGSTVLGAIARPAAVFCVLLVGHASVSTFVQLMSVGGIGVFLPIPDLLLVAGRCGLIAVALATVGGVRYQRSSAPAAAADVAR